MTQAADLVNALAPEHLELAVEDPEPLANDIERTAPFSGPLHARSGGRLHCRAQSCCRPRARRAMRRDCRYWISKRSSLVRCDAASLAEIGPDAMRLADEEGLRAWPLISIRLNQRPAGSGKNA